MMKPMTAAGMITLASLFTPFAISAPQEPLKNYQTSWIGNTFANGVRQVGWANGTVIHVPSDMDSLFVLPDGTAMTDQNSDESAFKATIFKDGKFVAPFDDLGQDRWGGLAITANSKYAYLVMGQSGRDGEKLNANGHPSFPPKGTSWRAVRRYRHDGSKAPFPSGWGHDGTMRPIQTVTGGFRQHHSILGLAATEEEVFVGNPITNRVEVFTTDLEPVRTWNFAKPGRMALDRNGHLWIAERDSLHIHHVDQNGRRVGPSVTLPNGSIASGLAVDKDRRLLVADLGPDENIKIYSNVETKPTLSGTFGAKGGITSGVPGRVEPMKFNGLTGVGTDAKGNIYVTMNGQGPVEWNEDLNYYDMGTGSSLLSLTPEGKLNWRVDGLMFEDAADVDPRDETSVYSNRQRFRMDYSKPPGQESAYVAHTVNRFKYPGDFRINSDNVGHGTPVVRWLDGRKFLFNLGRGAQNLSIFRFDEKTDGEIAIPAGFVSLFTWRADGWKRVPANQPAEGEWIWLDRNGDGRHDDGEFLQKKDDPRSNAPDTSWYQWVDTKGNLWQAFQTKGIRKIEYQGLNRNGVPIYDYERVKWYAMPKEFNRIGHLQYEADTDTMFISGYSVAHPYSAPPHPNAWQSSGKIMARYDNWSAKPTLRKGFPALHPGPLRPDAWAVAGDYIFYGEFGSPSRSYVMNANDGSYVGYFTPTDPVHANICDVDIRGGIRAYKRKNGEYLVFVSDHCFAKVVMYRWKPV